MSTIGMRALLFSDSQFDLNSFHNLSDGLGIGHTPFSDVGTRLKLTPVFALKSQILSFPRKGVSSDAGDVSGFPPALE
jgi:hypothetical protein